MESIQLLDPGTAIRLIGDIPASVAENPRDGAWLVARFSHTSPALTTAGGERLRAAERESVHGLTFLRDRDTPDVLVIVHADDIVGVA
jgi:hypothetical protein